MNYKPQFDPTIPLKMSAATNGGVGDRRDGAIYVYKDERIALAVNVALVTGRPLLLFGRSGTGKSSLARNVAFRMGFRYYETVVTSRTQSRDLLWEVDLLHRLHDAQIKKGKFDPDITPYLKPGVLWWAFNKESAARRGKTSGPATVEDPSLQAGGDRAVVLIDEIDKAEPDVPNNLLVPLGSLEFQVEETGVEVKTSRDKAPLVFITSNGERELPVAFLRRCIQLELRPPDPADLAQIGNAHFPKKSLDWLHVIATELEKARQEAKRKDSVGTAEYLDTVRACVDMGIETSSDEWNALVKLTVLKS
jgi:MoxR-like ATPase